MGTACTRTEGGELEGGLKLHMGRRVSKRGARRTMNFENGICGYCESFNMNKTIQSRGIYFHSCQIIFVFFVFFYHTFCVELVSLMFLNFSGQDEVQTSNLTTSVTL